MIRDVSCNSESSDAVIEALNEVLIPIIKETKLKKNITVNNTIQNGETEILNKCDELFMNYIDTNDDDDDDEGKARNYRIYQDGRNKINSITLKNTKGYMRI